MIKVLLTGSRGYIGSHATKILVDKGYSVIGIDSMENSTRDDELESLFYNGSIMDENLLDQIMIENKIDIIMHFAGLISVSDSVKNPELYDEINFGGTKKIVEAALRNGINKIIFSSTAAIYGIPETVPIFETDKKSPINPYGESKLKAEQFIINSGMQYSIFRYFNVAGSMGGNLGYFPKGESQHIIPIINEVVKGERNSFSIFGNDYNTEDGTCIRDYVHVVDLVECHILAMEKMLNDPNLISSSYNISMNKGYSVLEVYNEAKKIHGVEIPIKFEDRRLGDPDKLVASATLAKETFDWEPRFSLEDMIRSDFEKTNK